MAIHFSILAWRIPWPEDHDRLYSHQGIPKNWTWLSMHMHLCILAYYYVCTNIYYIYTYTNIFSYCQIMLHCTSDINCWNLSNYKHKCFSAKTRSKEPFTLFKIFKIKIITQSLKHSHILILRVLKYSYAW